MKSEGARRFLHLILPSSSIVPIYSLPTGAASKVSERFVRLPLQYSGIRGAISFDLLLKKRGPARQNRTCKVKGSSFFLRLILPSSSIVASYWIPTGHPTQVSELSSSNRRAPGLSWLLPRRFIKKRGFARRKGTCKMKGLVFFCASSFSPPRSPAPTEDLPGGPPLVSGQSSSNLCTRGISKPLSPP